MPESVTIALAAMAGFGLGTAFFVGLWWTLRRGLASSRPELWFLGSLLARTAILLAGFYYAADGHWERLMACVLGFVVAKLIVTQLVLPRKDLSHAP